MKIALIGTAPSSIGLAPYSEPSWKIWGCSPGAYPLVPRSEAWFEIHRWEPPVLGKPDKQVPWLSPEYVAWLAQHPCVWMFDPPAGMPNMHLIPHVQLRTKYSDYFFTSSLAWMFAMAIEAILDANSKEDKGPHAIGLWGVDMAACTSPETKILRSDLTWVPANEIKVGDDLIAFDEYAHTLGRSVPKRSWRKAKVLQADNLVKPCYRLYLEDGRELVCSEDHKWLTHAENECRWKLAKELVTPHHRKPTRIVKLCDTWETEKSWEAGYLAAALDGEGHLTQKLREKDYGLLRVGFSQRDNAMRQKVLEITQLMNMELVQDSMAAGQNGDVGKYSFRGGRAKTMEILGRIRPRRLMKSFDPKHLGIMQKSGTVAVVGSEFIGPQPVIGLKTSTRTFVAEGLASHNSEEYGYQRAGCQFFCMVAKGMGIEVVVPPESDLLAPPALYGLWECSHKGIKLTSRLRELTSRKAQADQNLEVAKQEAYFLAGALDDMTYQTNTWISDGKPSFGDFGSIFDFDKNDESGNTD